MRRFDRPVFIVAAPRSGSTMLFDALARVPDFKTIGGEAHEEFESVPGWHPRDRGYESNRLTGADATPESAARLVAALLRRMPEARGAFRFLEKTPKNVLRIPLLAALFPGARFIFLLREPRANVSSIMEAWRSERFVTYRDLPSWPGPPWSLLLPPGWRSLAGAPLERIAALQWTVANETAVDDLDALPHDRWCAVFYEDLVAAPRRELERLCAFAHIHVPAHVTSAMTALPHARYTLTPPRAGKWLDNEASIRSVDGELQRTWNALRARVASRTA